MVFENQVRTFWDASSNPASHKSLGLLQYPSFNYRTQRATQKTPWAQWIQSSRSTLFRIYFNNTSPFTPSSSTWTLCCVLQVEFCSCFSSFIQATDLAHLNLYWITKIIYGKYKQYGCLALNFLHLSITSFPLRPNIFPSDTFPSTKRK